jgi:hypothetical protein
MQVSGTPVDPFPASSPTTWWDTIWAHVAQHTPVWAWWIVGALLALAALALTFLLLKATWQATSFLWRRHVSPRPTEDVLTVVAASIATAVSAQGMWLFTGDVLDLDGPLRLMLFAFIEIAVITSAVRARRNMRENFSAGVDGIAVWGLTVLTAVLSAMHPSSFPEKVFRLAAPLVAAWLWERGMAIERHRIRGTTGINWRITPERLLVRVGLAEVSDRTAGDVDAHRRLSRVAVAVKKVRHLRYSGASERKQRAALAKLDKALDQAVQHARLASDEAAQEALLHQIDTLRSAEALINRNRLPRWADPVTQEQKAQAMAAIDEAMRFDTAEATQRALDKAAVTLMTLTERVTSNVTSERVNNKVNSKVTNGVVPAPRNGHPLTSPMTPALTPEVTVERVNNALNFDVTNPDAYALERLLADDPYVTRLLTSELSDDEVNNEVNEDPRSTSKTQVMRGFWDTEVAEDRYPSVKELSEHAGVDSSLASRKRKEWVAELPWWKRRKADPKRERTNA